MSKDIRRRIIRLEQTDHQEAIQYDVSDCPLEELESDLGGATTLSPILTEEEWQALYCGGDA
ncbi:hypothetical protein [Microvirga aerophila]|uniref:hypothetical protein n=1 Tax=Microvirga aerophila TaxID=670291 RepID=UPI000DEEF5DA|nr:hypothetical protein [Microvirga aerophila]